MRAQWSLDGFDFHEFNFKPVVSSDIAEAKADFPSFILMKDALNVATYEEQLEGRKFDDVLELGVMKGGSCAFFEALLRPKNHLAIDVYQFQGDGLSELRDAVAKSDRAFQIDYETDQTNIERIKDLWRSMTGKDSVAFDLIVDDASHSYPLSLKSFNGLFPLLRPGGVYALEDWGWAHWNGPWQDEQHGDFKDPSLSNLVVHAAFAVTGGSGMVESVRVTPNAAFITRGPAVAPAGYDVTDTYVNRGRAKTPF